MHRSELHPGFIPQTGFSFILGSGSPLDTEHLIPLWGGSPTQAPSEAVPGSQEETLFPTTASPRSAAKFPGGGVWSLKYFHSSVTFY